MDPYGWKSNKEGSQCTKSFIEETIKEAIEWAEFPKILVFQKHQGECL